MSVYIATEATSAVKPADPDFGIDSPVALPSVATPFGIVVTANEREHDVRN
jgi:hypothetical protein